MSKEIKIPSVGESITSGLIAEWHKKDGEAVANGDLLLTLETDKVSTEITAEADGVLTITVPEGEEVDIGAVVGSIEEGEGAPAPKAEAPNEPAKAEAPATPPPAETAPVPVAVKNTPEPAPVAAAAEPAPAPKPAVKKEEIPGRTTRKKMSPLRRKIAQHLVNAQQTAAILTTFNEVDMTAVMQLRKGVQESFVAKHGVKIGFMSFFLKAVVQALKDVPSVNAQIDGDEFVQNHFYDIGVAIGAPKGLVVPVVRDVDQLSFAEIEKSIIDYATQAKEGKLALESLQGGVFTVSNGGVYGSLLSTPILNPPQSAILGMHTIQQRPIALNGEVAVRPMMYLALSYDHRIIDGKEAVTFLIRIKDCLENPARLLIDA